MYINELGTREINQYYALRGGQRTTNIRKFANYMENAKASKSQPEPKESASPATDTSGSEKACCEKCQLTNQLMMRMMANNLYTQSGLGYSAMGSGALAAYQSLSKFFGTGVFS